MTRIGFCRLACPLLGLLLAINGCNVIGYALQGVRSNIPAAYTGLAGQSAVVYVWADQGVRIDWPDIGFNLSSGIQSKLQIARDSKTEELKGLTFPMSSAAVTRFQEDHPELEFQPMDKLAPLLHATRVIHVEISSFQTRAVDSVELYKGTITAIVKVLSVKDGKVATEFEDRNVAAVFPRNAPADGVPDLSDEAVYQGVVKELATQIVVRFIPHDEKDEQDEIHK
jgi:hypothetical protein